MATLRKRNGKWHAQIRLKGAKPITKTFHFKSDAAKWAREEEGRIQRGEPPLGTLQAEGITLAALLSRYRDTVTVRKKSSYTLASDFGESRVRAPGRVTPARQRSAKTVRRDRQRYPERDRGPPENAKQWRWWERRRTRSQPTRAGIIGLPAQLR